ncbi:MAG TPA: hypothetical protein VKN35_00735 [Xanthomonadales bacterium]|nr:hypothetical protein [Xanthomonadales bacterium]
MNSPIENMKKLMGLALIASAALLLGACASSQPAPTATASADASGEPSKTAQYQQAVQRNAKAKGVHVHWVHPPDEDDLDKGDG